MGADDMAPDQSEIFEAEEEARSLSQALAELPEKQRALIQRAYYGDLSHSEIAAETGLPLGTIKSRIRLALDKLRLFKPGYPAMLQLKGQIDEVERQIGAEVANIKSAIHAEFLAAQEQERLLGEQMAGLKTEVLS